MRRVVVCVQVAVACAIGLSVATPVRAQADRAQYFRSGPGFVRRRVAAASTVEASSPVLIEQSRSVVTDGAGRYRSRIFDPALIR